MFEKRGSNSKPASSHPLLIGRYLYKHQARQATYLANKGRQRKQRNYNWKYTTVFLLSPKPNNNKLALVSMKRMIDQPGYQYLHPNIACF